MISIQLRTNRREAEAMAEVDDENVAPHDPRNFDFDYISSACCSRASQGGIKQTFHLPQILS